MRNSFVLLLACSFLRYAAADTFTVSNTNDSGGGSLRQAILDANAHPNSANSGNAPDLIAFSIAGSGAKTISPTSALPTITEAVIINGYTQPGASANTLTSGYNGVLLIELNGTNAGNNVAGLTIGGGGSTVRGLVINSFRGFGLAITNGTGGHTIQGNFIGTDVTGTQPLGNLNNGMDITGSPENTIGGTGPGDGNLISANFGNAIWVHTGSDEATLQGNRIGTNPAGTAVLLGPGQTDQSNTGDGIILESDDNTVGGDEEGARNIIAANSGDAILMQSSNANTIDGNSIGTDATGTIKLGNHSGAAVRITDGNDNSVGGFLAGEGNLMADNFLGVEVDSFSGPALNNTISGNSIYSSRNGIGIDLDTLAGNFGVTPNDPGDADTGPNNFQNFPVITSATYSPGQVQIAGTLNSMPGQTYRVELFGNFAANSSGFGEGHYFLDSFTVMTDGSGNASFNRTPSTLAPVNFVSATATDAAGNSSEFAQDLAVANTPSRLANLSVRASVMSGDNVTIGGLIIEGKLPKRVLLRGLGPSLPASVPNRLSDPLLTLFDSTSTPIATNNDWKTNQAEVEATGLAPANDLEAAIAITLSPGAYTVILNGNGGGTGIGLVEIYDVTPDSESGFFNASGRALVGSGDDVLIGGIIIGGGGPVAFVVTAKGPSLPLGGTLADPTLDLYDSSGTPVASNDDWQDDVNQSQIPVALRPGDARESGFYRVLNPGTYTAIARGKGGATGIALVEIWDVN